MTTTNPSIGAWPALLREIMQAHADPNAREYNECDKFKCFWCEQAAAELKELDECLKQDRSKDLGASPTP